MSFNLKIIFSGLVMFVPNAYEESKARLCALLLDGTNLKIKDEERGISERQALDGKSKLRFHRAFLRFPCDIVSGNDSAELDDVGIWYLERQRLILKTDPHEQAINSFEALGQEPDSAALVPSSEDASSFFCAADMNKVYKDFMVDPRLLLPNPPEGRVMAQFFIDQGTLSNESLTRFIMEYDSTLSDSIYKHAFSHEIALVLKDLEGAKLVAVSFDGSRPPRELDLACLPKKKVPGENDLVEVYLLNLCTENPLQWNVEGEVVPDIDSKWYYELLSEDDQASLKKILRNGFLPIPRPVQEPEDFAGPGSPNCIPKRTSRAVEFSAPELDSPGYSGT
jgi:hypothetical protein